MSYRKNYHEYDLVMPGTLAEALDMLGAEPGRWKPFAGGTDLMVLADAGHLSHRQFISISGLPELKTIQVAEQKLRIGAAVTYSAIQKHPVLMSEFPALCKAAGWTGSVAIQNRGTLGGNIANASPAGDSLPVLLACDAELELVSASGTRMLAYDGFHTGYKKSQMREDELIAAIHLPRRNWIQWTRKVGTRNAQAISKVCIAASAKLNGPVVEDCRIAFGSVAAFPLRVHGVENLVKGRELSAGMIAEARAALEGEIHPIDDVRSTAGYRLRVAGNLLEEFLSGLSR